MTCQIMVATLHISTVIWENLHVTRDISIYAVKRAIARIPSRSAPMLLSIRLICPDANIYLVGWQPGQPASEVSNINQYKLPVIVETGNKKLDSTEWKK